VGGRCLRAGSVGCRPELVHGEWFTNVCYYLTKGWRVEGATRCGWRSRYLCLYYSCPGRDHDNVAQSYHHWGRRQWSWLSVYTPCRGIGVPCWFPAQTPSIRGPFEEYVLSNHLLACGVKRYKHGAILGHRRWLEPGGSKIGKKSSLLSDDRAASSSEDLSTTAGCREVTCMRRAYTNSLQIGVASVIHHFKPFCSTSQKNMPKGIKNMPKVCNNIHSFGYHIYKYSYIFIKYSLAPKSNYII